MNQPPAPGAPNGLTCWSRLYQEHDRECINCEFKTSCKNAFLATNGMQQPQVAQQPYRLPVIQPGQPQPGYQPQPVYMQQGPWSPPRPNIPPPPVHYAQQPPQVQQAPQPPPQMVSHNFAQLIQAGIDPYRAASPYYQEESTVIRLAKNVSLKMAETGCLELARFFHLWPWPGG